jgi:hypothetical protein
MFLQLSSYLGEHCISEMIMILIKRAQFVRLGQNLPTINLFLLCPSLDSVVPNSPIYKYIWDHCNFMQAAYQHKILLARLISSGAKCTLLLLLNRFSIDICTLLLLLNQFSKDISTFSAATRGASSSSTC